MRNSVRKAIPKLLQFVFKKAVFMVEPSSPEVCVLPKSLTRIVLVTLWGNFFVRHAEVNMKLCLDIMLSITKLGAVQACTSLLDRIPWSTNP